MPARGSTTFPAPRLRNASGTNQRFFPRAEAPFARFLGDATFGAGMITLCTGIARLPRINPEVLKDGHQRLPELVERRLRGPDVEHHQLVVRTKRCMIRPPWRIARP